MSKEKETDQVAVPRDIMQKVRALKLRLANFGKRVTLQDMVRDALTIYVNSENERLDK